MESPPDPTGPLGVDVGADVDVDGGASLIEPETGSRLPVIIGLAVFIVVAAAAFVFLGQVGTDDGPRADGFPDITFVRSDGEPGSMADYAGRPLVLNFFASWCAPCRAEMPDLQQVHLEAVDTVQFLGLAVPPSVESADELIAETGVTYPWGIDEDSALLAHFEGPAMPTTVFIRADGEVAEVHAGILSADDLRARVEAISG